MLDTERIVQTAIEAVDAAGDFTMQDIAGDLGVHVTSLYHHVGSRAGVVDLMRAYLIRGIDMSCLELSPWQVALTEYFRAFLDTLSKHPRIFRLVTSTPTADPTVIAAQERVLTLLIEHAGQRPAEALQTMLALEVFTLATVNEFAAPDSVWDIPDETPAPRLREALDAQKSNQDLLEKAFERGIKAIVDSVAT